MPHPSQLNRRAGGKKGPRQVTSKRQPKVNLRPAPARDPAAAAAAAAYEADSDVSEDDAADYRAAESTEYGYREALRGERKPLEGLRVSVSGCDGRKEDLLALAEKFGAERHGGLQEDTTHLVTETPAGKKYDVALQRRMHVMKPSWLPAVRDAWMSGDDVDFRQLELDHAMPPLTAVVACLTGFAKGDYKDDFKRLLASNGATFAPKLDSRVTHLVVASPSSPHSQTPTSDKLLHVRKNAHRLHPHLAVVWEGWAREAVKYGGIRSERTRAWAHKEGGQEPQEDVSWQVDVAPPRCRSTARRPQVPPLALLRGARGGSSGPSASSSRTIVPVPGASQLRRSFQGYDATLLDKLDSAADDTSTLDSPTPAFDLAHGKVLKKRRRLGADESMAALPVPSASQVLQQQAKDDSQALLEAFGASQTHSAAGDASRFADADTTGLQSVSELLAARAARDEEREKEMALQLVPGRAEMQLVPKGKSVIKALSNSRQESFVHAADGDRPRRLPAGVAASKKAALEPVPETNAGHDDSAFFDSAPAAAATNEKSSTVGSDETLSSGASSEETVYPPIFSGKTFALMELKSPRVSAIRRVIAKCAGVCIDDASDDELAKADYLIVDYVEPPARFANSADPRIRTVCWIELCIFNDALLEPADRLLERPISFACPVPGLDSLRVHFSGFGPEEEPVMHHFRRYCAAVGAVFSAFMDRSTTHLVVGALEDDSSLRPGDLDAAQYPKVAKAREWGLAVCSLRELRRTVELRAEEVERDKAVAGADKLPFEDEGRAGPVREITNELDGGEQSMQGPLSDCVVFFSTKLDVNRKELASVVQDLGGIAARQYGPAVTHFVFAGVKASESSRDFKLARADGALIVHPRWIEECGRAQSRISEKDFPHTFDARKGGQLFDAGMSLQGAASSPRAPPAARPGEAPRERSVSRTPRRRASRPPARNAEDDPQLEAEGAKTVPSSPGPSPARDGGRDVDDSRDLGGFDGHRDPSPLPAVEHTTATSSPRQPLPHSEASQADASSDFELPPLRSENLPVPTAEVRKASLLAKTSELQAHFAQPDKPHRGRSRTALSRGKSSGTISLTTSKQPSPLAAAESDASTDPSAAAGGRIPGHVFPLDPSQATQDESLYVVYDNVAEAAAREQIRRALAGDGEAPPAPEFQDPIGSRTRRARASRR